MKYIIFSLVIFTAFFSPTFAQIPNPTGEGGPNNPSSSNPSVSEPIQLQNPLGGSDGQGGIRTLPELIEGILRIVLTIGTPIVALAIIYAGFLFITAQGNPTKLQTARQTLMYVLIGGAILLAAYVIAEAVVGTVNAIRGQ